MAKIPILLENSTGEFETLANGMFLPGSGGDAQRAIGLALNRWYIVAVHSTLSLGGTSVIGKGTVRLYPFVLPLPAKIGTLKFSVASAYSGDYQVGVFNSINAHPGVLVWSSTKITGGLSVGDLLVDVNSDVLPPNVYWVALRTSTSVTLDRITPNNVMGALNLLGSDNAGNPATSLYYSLDWVYDMPTDLSGANFPSYTYLNGSIPKIYYQLI